MTSTAPNPLHSQRAASDPSASVWVNASAGSGKTTVLTARVTRLLLAGVRPEKILCLTYTRAGAAEMSNRVTAMLSKWAVCDETTLDEDLDNLQNRAPTTKQRTEARRLFARVLACPGGLRIRTIHSFCQEILSRFPIEAGLPPHFALIDEQEMDVLRHEVLDDLLREAAEAPESDIAQALATLVATQGEAGFSKMLQEVTHIRGRLSGALASKGGMKNLLEGVHELLELDPGQTADTLRQQAMATIPETALRTMSQWLLEESERYIKRGQRLIKVLETPADQRADLFDLYCGAFLTQDRRPLSASFVASKKIRQLHPEVDTVSEQEALRLSFVLERIEATEIAHVTNAVLLFGNAFSERLAARKAMRAALDYDDLILFTENLLHKPSIAPWILYKLDNGIDHILVDEAQDTSRAQWNIVQALTEEFYSGLGAHADTERTLFVVGDEKQSIFSFQNADPEAFLSLRDYYVQHLKTAGKTLEKIGLHISFRSAPAILKAVDAIFAQDAARAGVSPEPIIHSPWKNRDGSDKIGQVEIWPLLKPAREDSVADGVWIMPTGYEDEHDPQAELAQQIARKIKGWLATHERLPGTNRPIAAGDVLILLRRRGRFADLMVRALKTNAVPVTGVDRMQLIAQLPVMDLLAVIRFVLLPEDDLNLATLLRSPLLGISEDQLMQLAIGREGSLWQSLQNAHSFSDIHAYLASKLSEADFSTPFAFLSQILNAACPGNTVSGRKAIWSRLGDEALDPIEELLNEAQAFAHSHSPSLQNFLHWLTQSDAEIKRELDQGGGQVRIMTVHASKGLEAPLVFLPDTVAVPRATEMPKFQWSEGDIPVYLSQQPDFGRAQRLWQKARDKQLQEYRRLFYVALTRASHRLYICGWLSGKSETAPPESWYGLATEALRAHHQDHARSSEEPVPDIVIADSQGVLPPLPTAAPLVNAEQPLPSWASQPVTRPAISIGAPPSTAETAAATPDAAFTRGRIIHRLLQSLPEIAPAERGAAIARFLDHPRHELSVSERSDIAAEVSTLLSHKAFEVLFGSQGLAEAPLTGTINGVPVFRQVDRLCFHQDEVWIVDYKTNRPPPLRVEDVPVTYRQQLHEYRLLLGDIYPDKNVRCFLLWTYAPRLMEIDF